MQYMTHLICQWIKHKLSIKRLYTKCPRLQSSNKTIGDDHIKAGFQPYVFKFLLQLKFYEKLSQRKLEMRTY